MNPVATTTQMTLDFEVGLAERHESLKACVRERVYANRKPMKALAADLDMSQSELTRKLAGNPDDPRNFSVDDLELYITTTGDTVPILYLVEKFLQDDGQRQKRAVAQLERLLPDLAALIKQARG